MIAFLWNSWKRLEKHRRLSVEKKFAKYLHTEWEDELRIVQNGSKNWTNRETSSDWSFWTSGFPPTGVLKSYSSLKLTSQVRVRLGFTLPIEFKDWPLIWPYQSMTMMAKQRPRNRSWSWSQMINHVTSICPKEIAFRVRWQKSCGRWCHESLICSEPCVTHRCPGYDRTKPMYSRRQNSLSTQP